MSLVGLLQSAAVITIVFSIVTSLDIPHHHMELFAHFRLQYLVATVLLLIVFAVLGNLPYSAALLLTAVLNGSLVIPWYLPGENTGTGGEELKLIHANVHARNDQYRKVADLVSKEQPDIIFLQEMTGEWVAAMHKLLVDYPYSYTEPRAGNFGIAVFSKLPFDSATHIDSPPLSYPTTIVRVTRGEKTVDLISTHPTVPLGRRLHDARNEQIASLVALVDGLPGNIVLLGDFNESMWGPQYRNLLEATGLDAARKGFGVVPTWPTFFPLAMIPIDHVFVSSEIGVTDFRAGRGIGSDHLPLVVTLSL